MNYDSKVHVLYNIFYNITISFTLNSVVYHYLHSILIIINKLTNNDWKTIIYINIF